jgi:hypothetical protein
LCTYLLFGAADVPRDLSVLPRAKRRKSFFSRGLFIWPISIRLDGKPQEPTDPTSEKCDHQRLIRKQYRREQASFVDEVGLSAIVLARPQIKQAPYAIVPQ